MQTVIKLGIFPNMEKEKVCLSLPKVVALCRRLKIEPVLPEKLAAQFKAAAYQTENRSSHRGQWPLSQLTAAVSLGGDGTFLKMVRTVMTKKIPVFGINFGHLGFLAELEYQGLPSALKKLSDGHYTLEKRKLLECTVHFSDGQVLKDLALNEFVLARGPLTKMAHLEMSINGKRSGLYAADGIIMATATGSTAYSLSAGGPLAEPGLAVMIITPVCAHALSARPLVIPLSEKVSLKPIPPLEELLLTADGSNICTVGEQDLVTVGQSRISLRMLKLTERSYYETWQEKLIGGL